MRGTQEKGKAEASIFLISMEDGLFLPEKREHVIGKERRRTQ